MNSKALWSGCCLVLLVFGFGNGLGLVASIVAGILTFYGLLLFSQSGAGGKGHKIDRILPWFILFFSFWGIVFGPNREYATEYEVCEPIRNPQSLPLAIDGVQLGMKKDEVESAIGRPRRLERVHVGKPIQMAYVTASNFLKLVREIAPTNPDVVVLSPSRLLQAEEHLKAIASQFQPHTWDPTGAGQTPAAQKMIDVVKTSARGEVKMTVWVTDDPLSEEYSKVMAKLPYKHRNDRSFFVLSLTGGVNDSAFYTEDRLGTRTWYGDTALFYEGDEVVQVSGRKLMLGTRTWAQVGGPLTLLNAIGEPLTPIERASAKSDMEHYVKTWNGYTLEISAQNEVITDLKIYQGRLR